MDRKDIHNNRIRHIKKLLYETKPVTSDKNRYYHAIALGILELIEMNDKEG